MRLMNELIGSIRMIHIFHVHVRRWNVCIICANSQDILQLLYIQYLFVAQ